MLSSGYCITEETLTSFEDDWLDYYDFICEHQKIIAAVFAVLTTAVFYTQRRKVNSEYLPLRHLVTFVSVIMHSVHSTISNRRKSHSHMSHCEFLLSVFVWTNRYPYGTHCVIHDVINKTLK